MLVWAVTLGRVDLGQIGFGVGAIAFAGCGVFLGALLGGRLLNASEKKEFFKAPPDDA